MVRHLQTEITRYQLQTPFLKEKYAYIEMMCTPLRTFVWT